MSSEEQVGRLLAARFKAFDGSRYSDGRVVFWHDESGEFSELLDRIAGPDSPIAELQDIEPIRLERNPFALKHRILDEEPTRQFLVYIEGALPDDENNWLLDLQLAYGPLFTADKLSMILNEVFPHEASTETKQRWMQVMQRTKRFFDDDDLVDALAARLKADDDELDFQAKMIASLLDLPAGSHSLEAIWRRLLADYADGHTDGMDLVEDMGLADYHWAGTRAIYHFALPTASTETDGAAVKPTVKDFVLWLFALAWHGFTDGEHAADYYANIHRDFDMWRNDPRFATSMRTLATEAFEDLGLGREVIGMSPDELSRHDVFRGVDEQIVSLLYEAVGNQSIADADVQRIIDSRNYSLWHDDFAKDYEFIASASALRALLDLAKPVMESIHSPRSGFELYVGTLHRADRAYRRFVTAWKNLGEKFEGKTIEESLEAEYTMYQSDLGITWQSQVDTLDSWEIDGLPSQGDFYARNVKKVTDANKKIAVIISDALRYEVADQFAESLNEERRWTATMDAQLSTLPSYTQLGMAALLPHKTLALAPDHYHVLADGKSTQGVAARNTILAQVGGTAVQAKDLLAMKRDEYRDLVKSSQVLYVYHNHIDAIGDDEASEAQAFEACARTIDELKDIVRRLANANVTNMIVTADHGFLYQNHDVADAEWLSERPAGKTLWKESRRFVLGAELAPKPAFTTFNAARVGLDDPAGEGVTVQVPNSIHRLRIKGPGVRYVHGGASLPEIVVPVVHINKGRTSQGDTRPVEFQILQKTDRISTGQVGIELLQTEPVGGKVNERTLYAGLWGVNGDGSDTLISTEVPVALNSTSRDSVDRHHTVSLLLTGDADKFNNKRVELRLRERIEHSNQMRTLDERAEFQLRRGIIDDGFDFFN